jgi:predicted ATPase
MTPCSQATPSPTRRPLTRGCQDGELGQKLLTSLVVPSWVDTHQDATLSLPRQSGTRVGTVAAIFGPNASGKSNVLEAIGAMRRAVVASHQRWDPDGGAPQEPFLLDEERRDQPTTFEVDLCLDDDRFQYGFRLDKNGIASEWLFSYPQNRRRLLYERRRDEEPEFRFGKSLTGQTAVLRELTRPNSLFLSVAAANNHRELSRIHSWFSRSVRSVTPDNVDPRIQLTIEGLSNETVAPRIRDLLRLADLGIVDARMTQLDMPEEALSLVRDLFERMPLGPPEELNLDEAVEYARRSVELDHQVGSGVRGLPVAFDLESRGTRNWFALLGPLVLTLERGGVLLIDELDASLHPHLSSEVIRMFHDPQVNKTGAQLILTSHDPTLLGNLLAEQPPLRRDEIWITEKDQGGVSHLYALTDFTPRKSENIERGYLQGRYGGVPFVDHERVHQPAG